MGISTGTYLCMRYANNRKGLKELNLVIKNLLHKNKGELDITKYRENYYEESAEPYYDLGANWNGWAYALQYIGGYSEDEIKLAKLIDRKKKFIKEAGIIKRSICNHGRNVFLKKIAPTL